MLCQMRSNTRKAKRKNSNFGKLKAATLPITQQSHFFNRGMICFKQKAATKYTGSQMKPEGALGWRNKELKWNTHSYTMMNIYSSQL